MRKSLSKDYNMLLQHLTPSLFSNLCVVRRPEVGSFSSSWRPLMPPPPIPLCLSPLLSIRPLLAAVRLCVAPPPRCAQPLAGAGNPPRHTLGACCLLQVRAEREGVGGAQMKVLRALTFNAARVESTRLIKVSLRELLGKAVAATCR